MPSESLLNLSDRLHFLDDDSFGSFAYDNGSQAFCPSVIIQFRKSYTTNRFAG